MIAFALKKLLRMIAVLAAATLIMFLLMHTITGNPWGNYSTSQRRMLQGIGVDTAVQVKLSQYFGLDLPVWRQFTRYLIGDAAPDGSFTCGVVCGNLGPSIQVRGLSVQTAIFGAPEGKTFWESRFGYSIRLVLLGALIAVGLGLPLGILIGVRPNTALSRAVSVSLAALISIPNFVLGLLAIIVLASWLKVVKVIPDWTVLSNWIAPAVVLAVMPMASIARVTRASLLNVLNEDYIRTAHAKGLTKARVMWVHILKNVLVPIVTFLGTILMEMLTGLFVVESLYAFPGIGRGYWEAVLKLDYPMIMGLTLIYAVGTLLVNILVEILCETLDPRIRSAKQVEVS